MRFEPIATLSDKYTIEDRPMSYQDLLRISNDNFVEVCRSMCVANGVSKVASAAVRQRFIWILGAFESVDYERLSVRAVYYRIVSLYGQPKTEKFYKLIQRATASMRDYGLLPFSMISDGSRSLYENVTHEDKESFMAEMAATYKKDMWQNSSERVIIVVEKQAMVDVLMPICSKYGVGILPSKGFNSKTAWYELMEKHIDGTTLHLLLLTDYDTAGLEMDVGGMKAVAQHNKIGKVQVKRIGLTEDQINEMNLPTRDDKLDDGLRACELDAMTPVQARALVEKEILPYVDSRQFRSLELIEAEERAGLELLSFGS